MHEEEEEKADDETLIRQTIAQITQMVKETDTPYTDPEFPANDKSLYINPLDPPSYAEEMPLVEWRRPQEIYTQDEPLMLKDGASAGDIKQGILGDCWLLGAFMTLATNNDLLKNLIFHDGIKEGFAVF
mmetsp:Transcript_9328/g.6695  ORF Transcript_9328/g.6695 Transcript_9328/m.6695 type:complete len:129 (+) Transcript_9328:341-727(+)